MIATCRLASLVAAGREVAFIEATAMEVFGRSETGVIEGLPNERKGTKVVYELITRSGAI
jgi:hypothetical protein